MNTNIGMAGEFRCVVKKSDGSTKIDTGYQKNLILNQGLDFFGGVNGENMMQYCVIGSGNSKPVYTQNQLDVAITGVAGYDFSTKYDYDASRDGNLYKTNKVRKYTFNGLDNVNISEVGLASQFSSSIDYYLCTRALIKDTQGVPTTITVLSGEVLEIYYKLWQVFDTTDRVGTINLLDGVGGSVAYNYSSKVVTNTEEAINYFGDTAIFQNRWYAIFPSADTSTPSYSSPYTYQYSKYVDGSYKIVVTFPLGIDDANGDIRLMTIPSFSLWQIRFGSVADDSPITKTSTQTLSIPIEVSWGRYEGEL